MVSRVECMFEIYPQLTGNGRSLLDPHSTYFVQDFARRYLAVFPLGSHSASMLCLEGLPKQVYRTKTAGGAATTPGNTATLFTIPATTSSASH